MVRIVFTTHFFGDDSARRAEVDAAAVEMKPLAASSSTGDPVSLRIRATGLSSADIGRITGTNWTDGSVETAPAGQAIIGTVSALELQDEGVLEFLLTPSASPA